MIFLKSLKIFTILVLVTVLSAISVLAYSAYGSRGDEVREIQTRLAALGYYGGTIDGIYGTQTKKAVQKFQQDRGLTADGIAGKQTLNELNISDDDYSDGYSSADYNLLARIISAEARGESYAGQVAVGAVILNRIEHPSFPDSISGVVYQPGAFSCLYDGQFDEPVADSAYSAARDALNGWDPSGGAIYYYNPKTATNKWIRSRPVITTIGRHVFCE
ncbi:MAG: spore cortex-lytic enzyme [Acutalibacteraceae bacterium]|nr:spore cortex-lytic enzyme [Acutalibacteraceae bacterium]